ncbi:Alpha/Beta hydrolase protein [Microdochium trichocladiopsis]|uniref:Alpha/Beta hydrolase protein n=1 Tax=Microdochium trichocladiopsis TaxID=1682393 RepID=A0A9P8XXG4_9PEZI|nr:Alpha/Beta hydrolase protein [Microdochium trichocladiopsis]KAH7018253.1 Alpha/Beta hydrolase protein [Microdochium trichocladiopsis]
MAPHQVADYDDTLIPKEPVPFHGKTFIKTEPIPPTAQQNEQKPQRNWLMGEKAFKTSMPHHQGIKALWETKWKFPCTKSVYPFHDGAYEDFAPVFEHLIAHDINDGTSPEYTRAFFPVTEELEAAGDAAVQQGQAEKASELYLRAACVLRIARFPYISAHVSQQEDPDKWRAWEWQKKVYMKAAGQLWEPSPVVEVDIPHVYAANNDLGLSIPAYHGKPVQECPVVILLTGLDGYRPDNTVRCNEFLARGWACVVLEIPGTADCPADPSDPAASERLWDSLFSWMRTSVLQKFDMARVLCWGLSAGGYHAIRIAHTHAAQLAGVVAQGAGSHYFFDREWIEYAEGHEYPFKLAPAMARKHGFDSVEEYKEKVQGRFSLLANGLLDPQGGSARLLLVNGMQDGLMPIEDSMLLFEHGSPKEARFFAAALHMGYPLANSAVYPWMEQVVASVVDKA